MMKKNNSSLPRPSSKLSRSGPNKGSAVKETLPRSNKSTKLAKGSRAGVGSGDWMESSKEALYKILCDKNVGKTLKDNHTTRLVLNLKGKEDSNYALFLGSDAIVK